MQSVRSSLEYPKGGGPQGTTRFDAELMRPVVIKDGQAVQNANFGNVTSVTTTYQMLPSDGLVLAGNTTSYTVTLPEVADVPKGHVVFIKKTGASGTLTIEGAGAETIDGSANVTTSTQNDLIALVENGTSWSRINLAGTAGALVLGATTKSSAGSVAVGENFVVLTGTSTYNLALPAISGTSGQVYYFKKTGASGTVTLTTPSTETIDGENTFAIATQWMSVALVSDGTNWHILNWQVVDPTP